MKAIGRDTNPVEVVEENASPKPRARRGTSPRQLAKNAETRRRLIEAAAKVVGRHGYAGASIARITEEAGVAYGAFYLHFENQQALFDVLLPTLGADMLEAISRAVRESHLLEDIERRGLTANFEYLVKNPSLYRVMNEAELYAPDAFRQHVRHMKESYVRSLRRSRDAGELATFSDDELETVADLLMGARSYLLMSCHTGKKLRPLTQAEIEVYIDVFVAGLISPRRKSPARRLRDAAANKRVRNL
jgi:AcrR family transcriptional regulator